MESTDALQKACDHIRKLLGKEDADIVWKADGQNVFGRWVCKWCGNEVPGRNADGYVRKTCPRKDCPSNRAREFLLKNK